MNDKKTEIRKRWSQAGLPRDYHYYFLTQIGWYNITIGHMTNGKEFILSTGRGEILYRKSKHDTWQPYESLGQFCLEKYP